MCARLSVVYITKNAGQHFDRSLASVANIADELLVVDSGSQDNTLILARNAGARIIERSWLGFAAQRQFAVVSAENSWVLMMDADEILTETAARVIRNTILIREPAGVAGYLLERRSFFHGKEICHGDWAHDQVLRLFDRRCGAYGESVVHEAWETHGTVEHIPGCALHHYSYANYGELLNKMRLYATLNAQQVHQRGKALHAYMPMTHALAAFWRGYFWRLGFLDGVEGAAIAWTTALGAFMKYAMALELRDHSQQ
ncbi:MAG: glycosyltransferase family 2 protein [Acidithiobacillus sp.]|jgi:(heptosyl)LPS beta-1,4-glucosyltransferase|uniref:glycosyltransferase family 2 protein n=2 Tax=Acidithiobacillus sp. TaxID=1872118 RepID=UPI00356AAAA5